MSDAGRDEVWTDLERLLMTAGAKTEARPEAEVQGGGESAPEVLEAAQGGEEGSALPFEDLLSELLGSWTEDSEGGTGDPSTEEQSSEVPLSALMARLIEDPAPAEAGTGEVHEEAEDEIDAIMSLEALKNRLLEGAIPSDELPSETDAAALECASPGEVESEAEQPAVEGTIELEELGDAEAEAVSTEPTESCGVAADAPIGWDSVLEFEPEIPDFHSEIEPIADEAIEAEEIRVEAEVEVSGQQHEETEVEACVEPAVELTAEPQCAGETESAEAIETAAEEIEPIADEAIEAGEIRVEAELEVAGQRDEEPEVEACVEPAVELTAEPQCAGETESAEAIETALVEFEPIAEVAHEAGEIRVEAEVEVSGQRDEEPEVEAYVELAVELTAEPQCAGETESPAAIETALDEAGEIRVEAELEVSGQRDEEPEVEACVEPAVELTAEPQCAVETESPEAIETSAGESAPIADEALETGEIHCEAEVEVSGQRDEEPEIEACVEPAVELTAETQYAGETETPAAIDPAPEEFGATASSSPAWAEDLFEALIKADDEQSQAHAAGDIAAESVAEEIVAAAGLAAEGLATEWLAADDTAVEWPAISLEPELADRQVEPAQSDGWEVLASLPAPMPPSFSEPILFEPALPADSFFDWPVVEHRLNPSGSSEEAVTFEEAEAGPEVESDDSLRRLVGMMLAEMAAAVPVERAQSLEATGARATERFLSFSLAGEVYAVALAGILETDRLPRVTRVPGLPAWAIGVSNLRGAILPVVDLRRLLSLEEAENPQDGRVLVVRPSPGDAPAALVVDRLEGVALLAPDELHPAPQWLDSKILPYLEGIGSFKGRLVNVLDLGRLFGATGVSGEEPPRSGGPA